MDELQVVKALSTPRMNTYKLAVAAQDPILALALYGWNARISAAFLLPLHVCEVVLRNAVADALEAVYGPRWPWSSGFEKSLPNPLAGFNPRKELLRARLPHASVGKVIAELKFAFWQCLLTKRHDQRVWRAHLFNVLPGLDHAVPLTLHRKHLHDALETLRGLRNRIAHHEPIFMRDLALALQEISWLVSMRCAHAAEWMQMHQQVVSLLQEKP